MRVDPHVPVAVKVKERLAVPPPAESYASLAGAVPRPLRSEFGRLRSWVGKRGARVDLNVDLLYAALDPRIKYSD